MDFNKMDWSSLASKTNFKEKKEYKADTRFWKLAVDETDKGQAIIRLLLDKNGVPFINLKKCALKAFDDVNKKYVWFINDLPISIGEKCPLSDFRSCLFNKGKDGQEEAKNFNYKNSYIANIQVIKDPANPENEGKVFLWEFGIKLLEKFQESMVEDDKNPWNPMKEGCNIKLRRKKVAGFPNYDSTTIEEPSAFMNFKKDKDAENYLKENTYDLSEFLDKDYFLSYDDLKSKLKYFINKYQPTTMDKDEFEEVASEFFNEEIGKSYKSKTQAKEDKEDFDQEPKEKLKKEVKSEAKKEKEVKVKEDNDLDDDIDDLLSSLDD